MTPNPSIERTYPGKPDPAAHVKRGLIMRAPSRNMPAFRAPSKGAQVFVWFLLAAAVVGFAWFAAMWSVLVMASGVAAVWLSGAVSLKKERSRLLGIAANREGESICHFTRGFNTRAVDTWVIRAVYEVLQRELEFARPGFPVRASDDLEQLLVNADDLDMAVAPEVGRRAGRSLENTQINPYYGKVRSVADLVMFFNAQPKTNET